MTSTKDPLVKLIEERVLAFYQAFKTGKDVSPVFQHRTEGMMDAAVLQGLMTEQELQQLKQDCYQEYFGEDLAKEDLGEPRQLLTLMQRAPVYPST
jgi:hypothetical protein